ncbi:O-antigen ligase family protein [Candidatus Parcubacteria bacterium]|nr:MAG: O-antigen ligase family protein [Candidatus Parcubacteria bacterium]
MYLVKFLLIAVLLSFIFGEFAHFPFGSSAGAVYLSDILLVFAIIFFIIWNTIAKTRIIIPKVFYPMLIFWIVAGISLLLSFTFFPWEEVVKGGLYLVRLIAYSTIFVIIFNLKKKQIISKEGVINTLIAIGIFLSCLGFIQLFLFPNFENINFSLTSYGFDPHQGRLASTFLDPNFTGAYLVLTLVLILYRLSLRIYEKKLWLLSALLIVSIILTYSRSAYLMLTVTVIVIGTLNWKNINNRARLAGIFVSLTVMVVSAIFFPRALDRIVSGLSLDKTSMERVESWQAGWKIVQEKPILGVGFNNVRLVKQQLNLFKTYTPDGGHAGAGIDSSLLTVWATTGSLGLIVYLSFGLGIARGLFKKGGLFSVMILGALAGLVVESQFINSLFYPPIMAWYFSVIGVLLD